MNKEQFEQLQKTVRESRLLRGSLLKNQTPRTLIYGYNQDREDIHVYLDHDGLIHVTVSSDFHQTEEYFQKNNFSNFEAYVPNKRVYPETVDFEFALLLSLAGESLPYTTPNWDRPVQQFYGEVK